MAVLLAKKSKGRKPRSSAAAHELVAAVEEMHRAVVSGDYGGMTIREVEIQEPRVFTAAQIRALRKKTGASVAVFAQLTGASAKLVEHWEQGRRHPAPLACRLLERIDADPSQYVASLVKQRSIKEPN